MVDTYQNWFDWVRSSGRMVEKSERVYVPFHRGGWMTDVKLQLSSYTFKMLK